MFKTKLTSKTDRTRYVSALKALPGIQWTNQSEQYCEYRLDGKLHATGDGWLRAKQYTNGTLMLDASTPALKALLTGCLPLALRPPEADTGSSGSGSPTAVTRHAVLAAGQSLGQQYTGIVLGSDESGKGDYFGPLVVAAALVTPNHWPALKAMGVTDSKQLTDAKMAQMAPEIIALLGADNIALVTITPLNYNTWTQTLKARGQNLNHLLAWGHAQAIETILNQSPDATDLSALQAIADQFGNEKYILDKLQAKGRGIKLLQTPKAEAHVAVAAASVLARDRFVSTVHQLSETFGMRLPLGANQQVITAAKQFVAKHGREALKNVAKLHFKTTQSV
jgi:ribonuclease HIII